ncbi:DNA-binding response regulator [Acrocarpospora phusangensis]|uniref:DNA-binding response regulator n=1 Tax=Acrocarpospora phusangensis TaxID=1070424 RepID=A0A919QIM8_9ACTN|nr:response regulator transcription factor [Acrocarpospora phusangensis]GIH26892.1 DNA-binding response regulator [Acrocarpospora phusangensis]
MIRVLVADDHPLYRRGLVGVLTEEDGVEVVGEAADGDAALLLAAELRPDVVLMDLHMPGVNGVEATRRLAPDCRVLVLTMFDDDESVLAATRAGARGYLVKGASGERIVSAVRAVAAGDAVFGADVAGRVLGVLAADRRGARAGRPFPALTDREREVLDLIATGRSNGEIARRLHLSDKTIRNHVSAIFAKLQVADRSQAIVRAREAGLGLDS